MMQVEAMYYFDEGILSIHINQPDLKYLNLYISPFIVGKFENSEWLLCIDQIEAIIVYKTTQEHNDKKKMVLLFSLQFRHENRRYESAVFQESHTNHPLQKISLDCI
jgi:hypothetical protein